MNKYLITIAPLSKDDGGGFIGFAPDLPGCMSDGETPQEALENTLIAIKDWIEIAEKRGTEIPKPGSHWARKQRKQKELFKAAAELARSTEEIEKRVRNLEIVALERDREQERDDDEWFVGAVPIFAAFDKLPKH